MRAVMVVVLPDIAEDAYEDDVRQVFAAVARALDIPETKGGRLIVAIRESADAILSAAEPHGAPDVR